MSRLLAPKSVHAKSLVKMTRKRSAILVPHTVVAVQVRGGARLKHVRGNSCMSPPSELRL